MDEKQRRKLGEWLGEVSECKGTRKHVSSSVNLITARLAELACIAHDYGGNEPHDGSVLNAYGQAWVTEAVCLSALLQHMKDLENK